MHCLKFLFCFVSLVAAYSSFVINPLTTHQPIGNDEGEVNFYRIEFTVESSYSADGSNATGICSASWSDNAWVQSEAYSTYVPTGNWIACGSSEFSFQLFPYFSIGNFTLAIQQNFTDVSSSKTTQTIASGSAHISNTTSQYTCDINPEEVMYIQHASGDCSIPSGASPFTIHVTSVVSNLLACAAGDFVNSTFITTAQTKPGQSILLVGSIPELGSWDTSDAILMISTDNDGSLTAPTWAGSVEIPAGTAFEYKYILRDTDGSETWECCENREFTIPTGSCSSVVGSNPDTFRSGGSPAA